MIAGFLPAVVGSPAAHSLGLGPAVGPVTQVVTPVTNTVAAPVPDQGALPDLQSNLSKE